MKKSIIRNLKCIIALVMVFIMLPASSVFAAWNSIELDTETKAQIQEDYLEIYKAEKPNSSYVQNMTADDIDILGYYGTYGGYEIVEIYFKGIPYPSATTDIEIGGYTFSMNMGRLDNYFFAYKDSEFIIVRDAYEQGLLTDDDMLGIAAAYGAIDIGECPFSDLDKEDWYYESVKFAYSTNLFLGLTEDTFGPEAEMTRAMLTTVLWRYAGSPTGFENTFSDVPENTWYTDAVAWAAENELVYGISEGIFAPDENITREQLAAIFYRYAKKVNAKYLEPNGTFERYADVDEISSWAYDSVSWAKARNVILGREVDGVLYIAPKDNATRAEVATLLMRFIEYLE